MSSDVSGLEETLKGLQAEVDSLKKAKNAYVYGMATGFLAGISTAAGYAHSSRQMYDLFDKGLEYGCMGISAGLLGGAAASYARLPSLSQDWFRKLYMRPWPFYAHGRASQD